MEQPQGANNMRLYCMESMEDFCSNVIFGMDGSTNNCKLS